MRVWLPVVLALPFALAGCPALLSDWTVSKENTTDASTDSWSPDVAGASSSGNGGNGGSGSSGSHSGGNNAADASPDSWSAGAGGFNSGSGDSGASSGSSGGPSLDGSLDSSAGGSSGSSGVSKPYFMLVVDTSGSMLSCTNPSPIDTDNSGSCTAGDFFCFPEAGQSCPFIDANADGNRDNVNSCGMEPTRLNDAKCALRQTVQAFAAESNFGLETYAVKMSGCSGGPCGDQCTATDGSCTGSTALGASGEFYASKGCTLSTFTNADLVPSCGNTPSCASTEDAIFPKNWNNGANVVVDIPKDPTWASASTPSSNVDQLLEWFDGQCDNSHELFAIGATPLAGSLNTAYEYFAHGWASTWNDTNYCATGGATVDHPTPLDFAQDRPCRSLNVILVTDGAQQFCAGDPVTAAADLYDNGVTIQGNQVPIKTYVIGFAGVNASDVDSIAQAGGTSSAIIASDDVGLSQALASVINGSLNEACGPPQ